jgi:hypothetical protein
MALRVHENTDHLAEIVSSLSSIKNGLGHIGPGQVASMLAIGSTVGLAWLCYYYREVFLTAVFVGALGGIVHELAQSNGRFILPHEDEDLQGKGVYLGGLFGLISGGVAGLILAQGLPEGEVSTRLLSEAFLAGLGLKGFAEAVATRRPQPNRRPTPKP